MQDVNVGMPFFDAMAKALISSELLLNSLMIKHRAYQSEKEVRLVIVGERKNLEAHINTRSRGSEIVPFIRADFPLSVQGNIAEIVIGPSAGERAESGIRAISPALSEVRLRHSEIPYRSS